MVSKCVLISSSLAWILSSRSCIVYWEQGKLVTNSYSNINMKRSKGVYSPCSLYSPAALLTQVLRKDFPLKASSVSSVLVAVSSVPSSCYKTPRSATGIYCYALTIGLCLSVKERHPCRSYIPERAQHESCPRCRSAGLVFCIQEETAAGWMCQLFLDCRSCRRYKPLHVRLYRPESLDWQRGKKVSY